MFSLINGFRNSANFSFLIQLMCRAFLLYKKEYLSYKTYYLRKWKEPFNFFLLSMDNNRHLLTYEIVPLTLTSQVSAIYVMGKIEFPAFHHVFGDFFFGHHETINKIDLL